jgi:hypothetical protein
MIYIKFLDPVYFYKGFVKKEDITKQSAGIVEVVGHLIEKTNDLTFVGTSKVGKEYINVFDIPNENIVHMGKAPKKVSDNVKTIKHKDMRITKGKFTVESVKEMKPLIIESCGFVVGETDESIYMATEKMGDRYRTLKIIPKGLIQ